MAGAIRESLPFAVGLVLVASPLITLALVLVTSVPKRISTMFVIGWAAGIKTSASLIVAFVDTSVPRGLPPMTLAVIRVALGALLGFLAVRSAVAALRSKRRRRAGEIETPPKWASKLAGWSMSRAFTIGFSLSAINPKNLAPTAAGAAAILEASDDPLAQAVAIFVFATVASVGIALPSVLHAIDGPRISALLERAAQVMTRYSQSLSAIVLTILAIVLLAKGGAAL